MKFVETQSPYPALASKTALIISGLPPPHAISAMNAARRTQPTPHATNAARNERNKRNQRPTP